MKTIDDLIEDIEMNHNTIGILLRGKSIENLENFHDKFKMCFVVNWQNEEFEKLGEGIKEKNIILYTNLKYIKYYNEDLYKKYNINSLGYPYCEKMLTENNIGFLDRCKKCGIEHIYSLDEKYISELSVRPRNTGITCIFYCCEVLKVKELWIIGLDFYDNQSIYINKTVSNFKINNKFKSQNQTMIKRFINYIKKFEDVKFNVVSNYTMKEKFNMFSNINFYGDEK